jgi:hypothetical protein
MFTLDLIHHHSCLPDLTVIYPHCFVTPLHPLPRCCCLPRHACVTLTLFVVICASPKPHRRLPRPHRRVPDLTFTSYEVIPIVHVLLLPHLPYFVPPQPPIICPNHGAMLSSLPL